MEPIAHIYTDLPQKFGIPRQSGLADIAGRIVFEEEYALPSAVKGLDGFTHLWLIWGFENGHQGGTAQDIQHDASNPIELSESLRTRHKGEWSPTVRPPRLGGSQRMGVFATRSPFRPNPIGLSCVRLDHVAIEDGAPVIYVKGADLRDGTPIYDVKPYIPYADCQPEASGGFTDAIAPALLTLDVNQELLRLIPKEKQPALLQVLELDPRPVGTHDPEKVYHLAYAGFEVSFTVSDEDLLHVIDIHAL